MGFVISGVDCIFICTCHDKTPFPSFELLDTRFHTHLLVVDLAICMEKLEMQICPVPHSFAIWLGIQPDLDSELMIMKWKMLI